MAVGTGVGRGIGVFVDVGIGVLVAVGAGVLVGGIGVKVGAGVLVGGIEMAVSVGGTGVFVGADSRAAILSVVGGGVGAALGWPVLQADIIRITSNNRACFMGQPPGGW